MDGFRVVASRSFVLLVHTLLFNSLFPFSSRAEGGAHPAAGIDMLAKPERARITYGSGLREIGGRTWGHGTSVTGFVVARDVNSVTVVGEDGHREAVPASSITSVELYAGTERHPLAGALIGAPMGALVGWALAKGTNDLGQELTLGYVEDSVNTGEWVLVGAGIGAGVGAFVGYITQTDRWQSVPTSDWQVHSEIKRDGSTNVSLSMQF